MKDLLEIINGAETVHYVVLNPKDNTVDYISDSLAKLLQNQDYHNKPLRYAVGCSKKSNCHNSAVEIQLRQNKVMQYVDCNHFNKRFLVMKFESTINDEKKHVMLFSDTEDTAIGSQLATDIDNIVTHEIKKMS